ncbi:hypothetical protein AHAS_Ahas05G0183600 [Arachis hypogaea]
MADWTYDVFLSFRGKDIRQRFIGHLYKALCRRGFHTFIDDVEIERGEDITRSLLTAVENSMIAIPVFSENYATSSFCLDELVNIMECAKTKGQIVLPVFYDVDPSDVRNLRGSFGEAMEKHEERMKLKEDKERLEKWKMAFMQAANLSGFHFKLGKKYEYVFIEKITGQIWSRISRVPLYVADYPIGLESRVQKVVMLLSDGSNGGNQMVGIYGVGGIGKTTLARAVYNLIADQFEGLCFLEHVRENSIKYGLAYLQEILLSKVLGKKDIKLASVGEGTSTIRQRFSRKKILLVLDDVDKLEQLRMIAGGLDWFGYGSRVIITTRNKHLLAAHGVERTYEVDDLNMEESLELLNWNAFRNEKVDPSYKNVLNKVVSYASGLPLALIIIGSNLFGRTIEEWMSTLCEYKKVPNKDIQRILKISFDALEEYQQKFFLDIACCFKGYEREKIETILHAHHDVNPKSSISVLLEKSLIKINEYGFVTLHDLIQDMGREIVRQESPEKPGERSRLWFSVDIMQVLQENTGTSEINMINLEVPIYEVLEWDGTAFKKMKNLKTLIIQNGKFSKGPKHLPNSLRVLEWQGYPLDSLPSDFRPKKLAILNLPNSCFTSFQLLKILKTYVNMRVLNFSGNRQTTQIPDASGAPNLEELCFADCENLIKIDKSVGLLSKLKIFDVQGCQKLRRLPSLALPSLEKLYLSGCSSLVSFPEIQGKMKKLRQLSLIDTCIKELPYSIYNLSGLQLLELRHSGIILLPSSIFMLRELNALDLWECECLLAYEGDDIEQVSLVLSSNATSLDFSTCNISDEFLQIFLPQFPNVQVLNLSYCNFTILPECISECRFLEILYLNECKNLQEIRGIPPNIEILYAMHNTSMSYSSRMTLLNKEFHEDGGDKAFILPGTEVPDWFELQSDGQPISFWFRNKFPALSLCVLFNQRLTNHRELRIGVRLIIKGNNNFEELFNETLNIVSHLHHVYICSMKQVTFAADVDEMLLKNGWNKAVISLYHYNIFVPRELEDLGSMQIGVHVIEKRSNMQDIRFSDPDTHIQYSPILLNSRWLSQGKYHLLNQETSTVTVQGLQEQKNLTRIDHKKLKGHKKVNKAKREGTMLNINSMQDIVILTSEASNDKNMTPKSWSYMSCEPWDPRHESLPLDSLDPMLWESWGPVTQPQGSWNPSVARESWNSIDCEGTDTTNQLVSSKEITMSDSDSEMTRLSHRTAKWKLWLCGLFSSSMSSSSSSLRERLL